MVWSIVPNPTKVVWSGTTGWRPVPLSATCHHAPMPTWAGSLDAVTGPPIQARLPLTAMHGAVGELDHVVGERVLLHGDAEHARPEQHIRAPVDPGCDGVAMPRACRGRGRGGSHPGEGHDRGGAEDGRPS